MFRYTPGVDEKPWDNAELGYHSADHNRLITTDRIHMRELEPEQRVSNFDEIVQGYDVEEAKKEADRCVQCGLCVATCPTHMAIPQYIDAVRDGDYDRGLKLLYESNPFSQVCGRVCTRKCEATCASAHEGDPIAIRWLKRHITEQVPYERYRDILGDCAPATGKKVAIIGAGPAGMTAAYDLVRKGHAVTVYEARAKAGGMTRYGIPEYRLPYDSLDKDIELILSFGVDIHYNTRIGVDITMEQLHNDYDAVLLAIGLQQGRQTRIANSEHEKVYRAVDLLAQITNGDSFEVPKKPVIIGGGNVAMDIARSLARLQKQQYGDIHVNLTALEDISHFMADPDEIKESREEGIHLHDSQGPQGCVLDDAGNLIGLRTWKVTSIFDADGRFAPQFDDQQETIFDCDAVIEAIGQFSDTSLLGEALTEQLEWQRGRLQVDPNGRTSVNWLWSAGDCVRGPDVVSAVADGHKVAASIHVKLTSILGVQADV